MTRILAYPLLFFVAAGLRGSGLPWLEGGWNLTAVAGLIMFYALAWELHRHQRQRRFILPAIARHPMFRVVASAGVFSAVCYIPGPETNFGNFVPWGGALLLLLSVPVFARRAVRTVAAETLVLLGLLAAGELLWLAPALIMIYSAWILDFHLGGAQAGDGRSAAALQRRFWPYFYPLLAVAGAATIGVRLVGHGLPYHMAPF